MDDPKKFCSYKGAVLANECDSNNHMNVMYYINKFEHAGRSFSHELGIGHQFLKEHNLGVAVLEQLIQYKREVFEDDILNIYSYAIGSTNKVMNLYHEMYNLDTKVLSATVNIKLVMFDMNKRKSVNIPEHIRQAINNYTLD